MSVTDKRISTLSDKTEYYSIDVFRIIAALAVMTIHVEPFIDISSNLNLWDKNVPARLAVPFFLLTTGYFIHSKIKSRDKVLSYVKHIIQLYLVYYIIYTPLMICLQLNSGKTLKKGILTLVKEFFLAGSLHLWYFLGAAVGVLLLYCLINLTKLSNKQIMAVVIVFYIIGVLGNAYKAPLMQIDVIENVLSKYYLIFKTTRNGLFFCLPYLFIGYYIRENGHKIKKHKYGLYSFIFFVLMNFEVILLCTKFKVKAMDMTFMLMPAAVFMFLMLLFIETPKVNTARASHYRRLSLLIFCFHQLINKGLFLIFKKIIKLEINSLAFFILVLVITVVLAEIIMALSNKKPFKWLKILY